MDEQNRTPPDDEIQEEGAIEQQLVPFWGDELADAATASGIIYVTLPGMCKALSLDSAGQLQRIRRTKTLAKGLRLIPLDTPRRGTQKINCLRIDKIALWLAGVQPASIKNAEYRTKIEAYQEELAPVATQVFLRIFGMRTAQVVPSSDPRVQELAEQIDTLTDVTSFLRAHMEGLVETTGRVELQLEQAVRLLEALTNRQQTTEHQVARIDERTQKLSPAHERIIQEMVERIVQAMKRQSSSGTPLAYSVIYGRFKTYFRLGRYNELSDERFEEAIAYLHEELRKVTGEDSPTQEKLF